MSYKFPEHQTLQVCKLVYHKTVSFGKVSYLERDRGTEITEDFPRFERVANGDLTRIAEYSEDVTLNCFRDKHGNVIVRYTRPK